MSTDALRRHCNLYRPGHNPHLIQINRSYQDDDNLPEPGQLVSVQADGMVVIEVGGEERRLWSHEPQRLERRVGANDGRLLHHPRWGLLISPHCLDESTAWFCVARADDPELLPCSTELPPDDPLQRLASTGAFLIRFDESEP
jgi:hypothetical protein